MYQAATQEIKIQGAGQLQAWISRPTAPGRYPAIALLHGRNGPSDGFKDVAVRFAEEGIVGLALNYMTHEEDPSLESMLSGIKGSLAYLQAQTDVNSECIAVGGYCKGGGLTYQGLGNFPGYSAGVVWHGGLSEQNVAAALRADAPMLILHGASDQAVSIDQVYELTKKLNDAGKQFELKVYWGCDHAFTLPGGGRYVPNAADDAFREAVLFLRRTYGLPVGEIGPLVREPVVA
jgi:carboxymethylenebutenolidase